MSIINLIILWLDNFFNKVEITALPTLTAFRGATKVTCPSLHGITSKVYIFDEDSFLSIWTAGTMRELDDFMDLAYTNQAIKYLSVNDLTTLQAWAEIIQPGTEIIFCGLEPANLPLTVDYEHLDVKASLENSIAFYGNQPMKVVIENLLLNGKSKASTKEAAAFFIWWLDSVNLLPNRFLHQPVPDEALNAFMENSVKAAIQLAGINRRRELTTPGCLDHIQKIVAKHYQSGGMLVV